MRVLGRLSKYVFYDSIEISKKLDLEQRLLTPNHLINNHANHNEIEKKIIKLDKETIETSTLSLSTTQKTRINSEIKVQCAVNETLNECGKVCEADCVSIFIRDECKGCGTPECSCIQGYARTNGTCVYWGDCPLDVQGSLTSKVNNNNDINLANLTQETNSNKFTEEDHAVQPFNQTSKLLALR